LERASEGDGLADAVIAEPNLYVVASGEAAQAMSYEVDWAGSREGIEQLSESVDEGDEVTARFVRERRGAMAGGRFDSLAQDAQGSRGSEKSVDKHYDALASIDRGGDGPTEVAGHESGLHHQRPGFARHGERGPADLHHGVRNGR